MQELNWSDSKHRGKCESKIDHVPMRPLNRLKVRGIRT